MNNESEFIEIKGLEVYTSLGISNEEQLVLQKVLVDLRFIPTNRFEQICDDFSLTVDYHAVALEIQAFAKQRRGKLLETFAADLAVQLFETFTISVLEIRIKKFILPDTAYVMVYYRKER